MTRKSIPRNEQETIIQKYRDTNTWHIYTCDEVVKRKIDKIIQQMGVSWTKVDEHGWEIELPRACVRFYSSVYTDEQKKVILAKRLRAARGAKKTKKSL